MMIHPEMIETAAQWWTDNLNTRSSGSHDAYSFVTGLLKEKTRPAIVDDQKTIFKNNLVEVIEKHSKFSSTVTLDCDYGPEYPLSEAARKAELNFKNFPNKTTMWIDFKEQKISIRRGTHAKTEQIYPVVGNKADALKV